MCMCDGTVYQKGMELSIMGEGQMRTTDSQQLGGGGMASSLISIYIRYIGICLVIANALARGPRMGECEEVFMF
jgi:hypothetical protein